MTALAERVGTRTLVVDAVSMLAPDVIAVTLVAADNSPLSAWSAGAHIEVTLPSGQLRQYSLCSDPSDLSRYRIAVRRCADGRGGSVELHAVATVGAPFEVSEPRNAFPLIDAPSYLLVAGGIGLTALLAAARELDARGATATLLYIGRGPALFADELATLSAVKVETVDTLTSGRPDVAAAVASSAAAAVYVCGPATLLDDAVAACDDLMPPHGLHLERFSAHPVADGNGFDVELARSGGIVRVDAAVSVLDALRDAGADVSSSCEMGICGTCETRVLGGTIEHRDDILSDEEKATGDTMMICVSRCSSDRLVLDL